MDMLQRESVVYRIGNMFPLKFFGKIFFRERMRKRVADKPVMFHFCEI